MQIPSTIQRVRHASPETANQRIQRDTEQNVRAYASAGEGPITHRLRQLEDEWDIERTLETNAAAVALAGVVLAATVNKRFLLVPGVVTAFLLQHALQGWCPPLALFRHLGVRTADEIDEERTALKALRGDFDHLPNPSDSPAAQRGDQAVRAARL